MAENGQTPPASESEFGQVEHYTIDLLNESSMLAYLRRAHALGIDTADPVALWHDTALRTWEQRVSDDIGVYYLCVRCEESPSAGEWATHACVARLSLSLRAVPPRAARVRNALTPGPPAQDCADLANALWVARGVAGDERAPAGLRSKCELMAKLLSIQALAIYLPYHPNYCPIDWARIEREQLLHPAVRQRWRGPLEDKIAQPERMLDFP